MGAASYIEVSASTSGEPAMSLWNAGSEEVADLTTSSSSNWLSSVWLWNCRSSVCSGARSIVVTAASTRRVYAGAFRRAGSGGA